MTDAELIKELRERPYRIGSESNDEARLRRQAEREAAADLIEALKAKLAKATEALQAFENFDDMPLSAKRPDIFERMVRQPILAALAEINGE